MRQSKPYLLDDIGAELLLREPLEVADHLIDDRDGGLLKAELEDVLNDVVAKGVLDQRQRLHSHAV